MPRALIISLGGSPDPVIKSIADHSPGAVCFFASQQSIDFVGEIKAGLRERGVTFQDTKVLCDDIDDLIHCYKQALTCSERLLWLVPDITPEQVAVDYTGGTKTMTAALALATIGKGFHFSYVGGTERTKDGLGIVIAGSEVVKTGVSPWQLFAVEEKQRIALYFNRYQFTAALDAIEHLPKMLSERDHRLFDCLSHIIRGYAAWDRFDHKTSSGEIGRGLNGLVPFCDGVDDPTLAEFCGNVRDNQAFLQALVKTKTPDMMLAVDLLSNARRRYEEGKYDDAVARLYRTLELVGQIAFRKTFGYETGDTPPDVIPEEMREEYVRAYGNRGEGVETWENGKDEEMKRQHVGAPPRGRPGAGEGRGKEADRLKLPSFATFRVLAAVEDPVGQAYFNAEKELRNVLSTRNDSILAHGTTPVKPEAVNCLESLIRDCFDIRDVVRFPALPWK